MNTQGMTPEEKAVVMQFMGETYGQLHKSDKAIVGSAGNLQPKSNQMKQVFEQTAHMPVVNRNQLRPQQPQPQPQPQPQQQPPPVVQQVTPEQAAQELAQPQPAPIYDDQAPVQGAPVTQDNVDPNQMELDLSEPTKVDVLINLVKEQHLLLKQISLKLDNGKKTTRSRKQG